MARRKFTPTKQNSRLTDLTPSKFSCTFTASCPGVFKDQNDGSYWIIGQSRNADSVGLDQRVGKDESLVQISREILEGALAKSTFRNILELATAMAIGALLTYSPQILTLL
jgi:hypothetical protein